MSVFRWDVFSGGDAIFLVYMFFHSRRDAKFSAVFIGCGSKNKLDTIYELAGGSFFLSQPKSYRFDEKFVVILQLVSLEATLEILRFYEVANKKSCAKFISN